MLGFTISGFLADKLFLISKCGNSGNSSYFFVPRASWYLDKQQLIQ